MRGFFKTFFAALLALVVFAVVVFFLLLGIIGGVLSPSKPEVGGRAVLVVDLGQTYKEQVQDNPFADLGSDEQYDVPGLYDVVRLLRHAKEDTAIKGIYLKCNNDPNGFATNEELRIAIADFKKSGKFVYAYGEGISQKAYYVASVADKIYCNPKGEVEWKGFATEMLYLKGALQKLEIQPQIFYAGKFKSATEPLREDHMTEANRIQLTELLNGFYDRFLETTAEARGLDTAVLRKCVNQSLIRRAADALDYKLVDGLLYDDEVKDLIRSKLKVDSHAWLNFIPIGKYAKAVNFKATGKDKISLIYAEGEVVDGKGEKDEIGSETYRWLIRKARFDKDVKAIVIRVNSGGGSSLASENIWREITLARKEKPVVISFGDVAASGAYYLSCNADSIFALPGTITGSIGVFTIITNLQSFFKNKLGVTFDGVKTAPEADILSATRPLTANERTMVQNVIDTIYHDFKSRVADGRKKDIGYVDSIAQGRVWSGTMGLSLGLVDRIGTLQDAVDCAARMAKTSNYRLVEYPEPKSFLDRLLGTYKRNASVQAVKSEIGEDGYRTYTILKKVKSMIGVTETRLPFDLTIE
ncbi:signal peptide peptidase SppA [Puia dinghuensis]|uniref:Signal peptide peptidase SppA n=1 Tax=Puia dinghuensis TaxID=1792502 RepID=A0A8J2XR19_9BACT|nr:signal peptide peptidase SppA [Puia dinghuensis]GGA87364.1 signal peptide peptidase SppA [Puia dinghuensis]